MQRRLSPFRGYDSGDLPVGHVRQTSEHIPQVSVRIDPAATAAFDDGVEDGAALAGIGFSEKEPVLFSNSSRPDRVLYAEEPIMPRRFREG